MTAASLSSLPLQAGSVALAHAGRAALWIISRYMRNPLTHSAIAALVVTSALAGSNALYGQHHAHPSPLFVQPGAMADVEPVIPAKKPKTFKLVGKPAELKLPAVVIADTGEPSDKIGNKDVLELQRKLEAMHLFSGTVDGYYGPKTASAIRKYEEMAGLKPSGQLSKDVIAAILAAPLTQPEKPPVLQPRIVAPADTAPAIVLPKAEAAPVVNELAPAAAADEAAAEPAAPIKLLAVLPEPKPLSADLTITASVAPANPVAAKPKLLGRPLPESADEALEMASATAGDAIETIVSGVQAITAGDQPALPFSAATQRPVPTPGVPLAIDDDPAPPGEPIKVLDTQATPDQIAPVSVTNPTTVAKVQRGLASLGFLHGPADGVAGEATAKAIRNFEVYFNYDVTGRISPELLDMLVENGAAI